MTDRIVTISAKSMRQKFHGCDPGYITSVCKGRCCHTGDYGTLAVVMPDEIPLFEAAGGKVRDGFIDTTEHPKAHCPLRQDDGLCSIHFTGGKPRHCTISPFALSKRDMLIVRNRFRMLICYKDANAPGGTWLYAYQAFASSLELLYGQAEAIRIMHHFNGGGGNLVTQMPEERYAWLRYKDTLLHKATR